MGRRVAVTGLGVACSAGLNVPDFWRHVSLGQAHVSAIAEIEGSPAPTPFVARVDEPEFEAECLKHGIKKTDRVTRLAALAAKQAWIDAGLDANGPAAPDPRRSGVIFGSGLGGLMFQEEQMWRILRSGENRLHPHSVPRISPTALVTELAQAHNLRGPGFVVSSACASGGHAIGQAYRSIASGEADLIVTGGAEAPLTRFTLTAFSLLGVLARGAQEPRRACKPFDRERDGFVLGEGAGVLVLESLERAQSRGARIYGEVCGFGQSLGAHHAVHVRPDGDDAAAAMQAALQDARIPADAVGYVNAHGTGTRENDTAEASALRAVFGAGPGVAVSSIKPLMGHTLGAAGALEAIATMLSLFHGQIPPSANCEDQDPDCNLDVVRGSARPTRTRYAVSNSFGFGNINVALVLGRYSDGS